MSNPPRCRFFHNWLYSKSRPILMKINGTYVNIRICLKCGLTQNHWAYPFGEGWSNITFTKYKELLKKHEINLAENAQYEKDKLAKISAHNTKVENERNDALNFIKKTAKPEGKA